MKCSCGNRAQIKILWPGRPAMYSCRICWRIVLGAMRQIYGERRAA